MDFIESVILACGYIHFFCEWKMGQPVRLPKNHLIVS